MLRPRRQQSRLALIMNPASSTSAPKPPLPGPRTLPSQASSRSNAKAGAKEKKTRKAARRSAGSAGALGKADAFLENNKNRRRKRRVSPPSPPRRSRMDSTEDGLFQVCSRAVALAP